MGVYTGYVNECSIVVITTLTKLTTQKLQLFYLGLKLNE